jgi:hypothetical protein
VSSLRDPRARARRRRLLSWLPTAIVAAICVAFVVGAVAMQSSWWTAPTGTPAVDQQEADGASRFDTAGVDYFTRDGSVRVKLRDDAASATDLGLPADGERTVEPIVPVTVVVLGPDGAFAVRGVSSFTVTTSADEVTAVSVIPDLPPSWQSASADLERSALNWGWQQSDIDTLTADLAAAARSADGTAYAAALVPLPSKGLVVDARIAVDGGATVTYGFTRSE